MDWWFETWVVDPDDLSEPLGMSLLVSGARGLERRILWFTAPEVAQLIVGLNGVAKQVAQVMTQIPERPADVAAITRDPMASMHRRPSTARGGLN